MAFVPVTTVGSGAGAASVVVVPGRRVMAVAVCVRVVKGCRGRVVPLAVLAGVVFVVDRHVDHPNAEHIPPGVYSKGRGAGRTHRHRAPAGNRAAPGQALAGRSGAAAAGTDVTESVAHGSPVRHSAPSVRPTPKAAVTSTTPSYAS